MVLIAGDAPIRIDGEAAFNNLSVIEATAAKYREALQRLTLA